MWPCDQRTSSDCLRCCVATLLSLPYEEVPDFLAEHDLQWAAGVANWVQERGYSVLRFQSCGDSEMLQSLAGGDVPWIATGPGPRGTDHAVIYVDDAMFYDPHLSREGILEITGALVLIPNQTGT